MKKILSVLVLFLLFFSPVSASEKIQMIDDNSGVYVFKINTKKYGNKIKPYIVDKLATPKKIYNDCCFELVVNGGFFDINNAKSVSYVTIDNELKADVKDYDELVKNLEKAG